MVGSPETLWPCIFLRHRRYRKESVLLYLFQKYGTEIVIISDVGNPNLDSQEMMEEIIALLHCYSMRMYSRRRGKKKLEIGIGSEKKKGQSKNLNDFIDEKADSKK